MRPRHIVIDGKPHEWRELVRLRREQLRASRDEKQLMLFEMRDDARPAAQRKAAGRYLQPSLFSLPEDRAARLAALTKLFTPLKP